jgi:hypothetical protein
MSCFDKYQKVKRVGDDECEGLLDGRVHVFPKLDGTNASVWVDESGEIKAGSRNRELSLDHDNHNFAGWVLQADDLRCFMRDYPYLRLYGEWLVPHTLKTYREDAWRRFYVFDVEFDGRYLSYEEYQPLLHRYNLDYIPCLAILNNPAREDLGRYLERATFMMQDGHLGEGIVAKNYYYLNKFGRPNWGKIVRAEFRDANNKEFGPPVLDCASQVEIEIAEQYVTQALVDKERAKIETSPIQPRLLQQVYHSIIVDDLWTILKQRNGAIINFKRLQGAVTRRTKKFAPDLFGDP